ncbi:hypothetical protein [Ideonella sp.]|uniref:hypothetical protein n=1 Tax=Ideonella sp. TaxID=1929293 RepID=UPI0035B08075
MTNRRTILTAAAAALAMPLAAHARSNRLAPGGVQPEHFVPGGMRGIQRGHFSYTPTDHVEEYGVIRIPDDRLFMIPITKNIFDESNGGKYAMTGDGVITVLKDDLYHMTANMDWPAQSRGSGQDGYDVDSRKLMILRARAGVKTPVYTQGEVTPIPDPSRFDRMAAHDTAGSSVPKSVRVSVTWEPGSIAAGGMTYTDVALPSGSFDPIVGDLVRVSHTSLTDEVLGEKKNAGVQISARIVAPGVARVMVENRYGAKSVAIPSGTMNVLAESAVASAGNNQDSWCYLNSGPVVLLAGEKVFVGVRSSSRGDFLQISNGSFLRIANVMA